MSKKAAIILSGCGYLDGAEIQESVLVTYFLQKRGIETEFFAPDIDQHHVVNHLTGTPTGERRNCLVEAARIARGKIRPLTAYRAADFDCLVMPGGFGAAKNFADYAFKGVEGEVLPDLARSITETHDAKKPILAICIAPVIVSIVLKESNPSVTIGDDAATIADLIKIGADHRVCAVEGFTVDTKNKIATTPAYMYSADTLGVGRGIEAAVEGLAKMLGV